MRRTLFALGFAALTAMGAAATPAQAFDGDWRGGVTFSFGERPSHWDHRPVRDGFVDDYAGPRHPRSIARSLHRRGFTDVERLRRRGGVYIAEATGPRGNRVRLVIDAYSGEIEGLRVLDRGYGWRDRRVTLDWIDR
jgi:hypothetical protein